MKEHIAMQNSIMKSPGFSSLNFSLKNLCLLGTIFAITMGLISTPYLHSSFETVIDEGKATQKIPEIESLTAVEDRFRDEDLPYAIESPSSSESRNVDTKRPNVDTTRDGTPTIQEFEEEAPNDVIPPTSEKDSLNHAETNTKSFEGGGGDEVVDELEEVTTVKEEVHEDYDAAISSTMVYPGNEQGVVKGAVMGVAVEDAEDSSTEERKSTLDETGNREEMLNEKEPSERIVSNLDFEAINLKEKTPTVEETENEDENTISGDIHSVSEAEDSNFEGNKKKPTVNLTVSEIEIEDEVLNELTTPEMMLSAPAPALAQHASRKYKRRKSPDNPKDLDKLLIIDQKNDTRALGKEKSTDSQNVLQENTLDEAESLHLSNSSQAGAHSNEIGDDVPTSSRQDLCDIFQGHWIPDNIGPLYSHNSCRVVTQAQNCQANGRPDKQYEFYKWQPRDCDIPRFNPLAFLKLMEGKSMAFIGDSVARNQFESLLCILLQVAEPKNRGNKSMQRWYFESHKFTLMRIWSGWLVRPVKDPFSFAPDDSVKLLLDELDDFAGHMAKFDVAVLSGGHWWMRKSAYILNGEIVGGTGWKVNVTSKKKIDQSTAYAIGMKNVLQKIGDIPDYRGLTVLRTYSPDHYEGGRWDSGGSCTGKTEPFGQDQRPKNIFSDMMRSKQVDAYKAVLKKGLKNGSSIKLLDIFEAFNFRADGHPGPYRNADPNKKTQRDAKGRPPPQDCLHWCMPGPVDTMNQLLAEVLKAEFEKD